MSDRLPFTQTLLLLGGNEGDVRSNGAYIAAELSKFYDVKRMSSWYSSPSWGFEGPDFLNSVLELELVTDVGLLLDRCLELELRLGRERKSSGYSNRPMDIDILYVGDYVIESEKLIVPHPRIPERRFTLVPLNEHWAGYSHPVLHRTQRQLLEECDDESVVTRVDG
ncbi:MAG: 2-amino-4-hydroxy-6-hydroxymethyldihydropteridine diphosphokinase [Flavobacteriia bacterium]|nr:2-amino-4-hydroxy-6-hydroxymethyldihydropteridine diphosphokinase [Flavobacteriia bacterium]